MTAARTVDLRGVHETVSSDILEDRNLSIGIGTKDIIYTARQVVPLKPEIFQDLHIRQFGGHLACQLVLSQKEPLHGRHVPKFGGNRPRVHIP
jgi:hypothetical protein